jgi:hypothetical protein
LKKRTKKLLIITGKRCRTARTNKQKFLLLFSKRSAFLLRTVSLNGSRYDENFVRFAAGGDEPGKRFACPVH